MQPCFGALYGIAMTLLPPQRVLRARIRSFPVEVAYDGPGDRLSVSVYGGVDKTLILQVGAA